MNITIEDIAKKYIEKIKKVQSRGSYHIAGWCIGGTIAFEMVRQMEEKGEEIRFFTLINTDPPRVDLARKIKGFTIKTELNWILEEELATEIKEKIINLSGLHQLWSFLVNHLITNNIEPGVIRSLFSPHMTDATPNVEQLGIKELIYYFNTIRTYDRARNAYVPASRNKTKVHFFGARDTRIPGRDKWNAYCKEPFKFYEVPGDHFSIFRPPHVGAFARIFNHTLKNRTEKQLETRENNNCIYGIFDVYNDCWLFRRNRQKLYH